MSILVVGTVALDTIKTPLGNAKNILGGSASYASVSASFFNPVNLVAVVGEDFPKKHAALLKNKGVDLRGLEKSSGETFRWAGEYGRNFGDAKTLSTHLNVLAKFNPKIPSAYKNSKYIFLANIDPKIQQKVLRQLTNPKLVVCDTMNYWIESTPKKLKKLLKQVDIFLLNESEARQLTHEANLARAGKKIIKLGPNVVVIKKGEHGVLLFSKNSIFAAPAFLLETVFDPTGAGDTFAGGFIGYLSKCKKYNQAALRKAVIYGSIMATFAVESFSLERLNRVTLGDINKRVKDFRKFTAF